MTIEEINEIVKELSVQKIAINVILKSLTKNDRQIKKLWEECEKSYENFSLTEKNKVEEGQMSIYDLEGGGKNE